MDNLTYIPKIKETRCGYCNTVLEKTIPKDMQSTIIKDLYCKNCKDYPTSITYIE